MHQQRNSLMTTIEEAYIKTAECFSRLASESPNPDLMELCADGLRELVNHYEDYCAKVLISKFFLKELEKKVKTLSETFDSDALLQHDNAFELMEDLIVIIREACLCEGGYTAREIQEKILEYFEISGLWDPFEPTMICDYYYHRIPISVMHRLRLKN